MNAFDFLFVQAGSSPQFAEVKDAWTGGIFSISEEFRPQLDGTVAAELQQHTTTGPADNGNDDVSGLTFRLLGF
jgi:hypothetical protein